MTERKAYPDLRSFSLFAELPTEVLDRVAAQLQWRSVQSGRLLMLADEPGRVGYLIAAGTAKVTVVGLDGGEVILSLLGMGELIGELSLVDSERRSATVEALENMLVLAIPKAQFEELLLQPSFARALMQLLARRLRLSNARLLSLASQTVSGRLAHHLLALATEYPPFSTQDPWVIPLRLTQSDMAAMVGAARQSVNRALSELTHRGYISVDTNFRVTILNAAGLGALSQQ